MDEWSLDYGTTNSLLARWNPDTEAPELFREDQISCEQPENQTIDVRYCIPSCLYVVQPRGFGKSFGRFPFFRENSFLGLETVMGREALEKDGFRSGERFLSGLKPALARNPYTVLAKRGSRAYTAREAAFLFMRNLFFHVKRTTARRPRHLTLSVPVDSFEPYRAELKRAASKLGVRTIRLIDEPVAAALGYGLGLDRRRHVLVIDFGGGTLDLALVETNEGKPSHCVVKAKSQAQLGGNDVDRWILDAFCKKTGYRLDEDPSDAHSRWWERFMIREACRVKEELLFREKSFFFARPPEEYIDFETRLRFNPPASSAASELTREECVGLLREKGLYATLERCMNEIREQAAAKGVAEDRIDDVLLVGGSTLLPETYALVEKRYGRGRVRAWQPFTAVVFGACAYAAGRLSTADFITHDYAIRIYDRDSGEPEYRLIVPRGTPFPTERDFWKGRFVPTCSLGTPERLFKLVICEIGQPSGGTVQSFSWDASGKLDAREAGEASAHVVPLNEDNPALGYLNPPQRPSDRHPRLEISFRINDERWLCATVFDLKTRRPVLDDEAVVKLK